MIDLTRDITVLLPLGTIFALILFVRNNAVAVTKIRGRIESLEKDMDRHQHRHKSLIEKFDKLEERVNQGNTEILTMLGRLQEAIDFLKIK